jgi:hypothetical protein
MEHALKLVKVFVYALCIGFLLRLIVFGVPLHDEPPPPKYTHDTLTIDDFILQQDTTDLAAIEEKRGIHLAPDYLQDVFHKLKKVAGITDPRVKLYIDYDDYQPNAAMWPDGAVILTVGEILYTKDHIQQLYFIIAHELAHWHNGDVSHKSLYCSFSDANSRKCEQSADLVGQTFILLAGMDVCAAGDYWVRWIRDNGNFGGGGSHPSPYERYQYLRCDQHIDDITQEDLL